MNETVTSRNKQTSIYKEAVQESSGTLSPIKQNSLYTKRGLGNGGKTSILLRVPEPEHPEAPISGALASKTVATTDFRRFYNRGDLPIATIHGPAYNRIHWKIDVTQLDYHHYLPIFFEGIREK